MNYCFMKLSEWHLRFIQDIIGRIDCLYHKTEMYWYPLSLDRQNVQKLSWFFIECYGKIFLKGITYDLPACQQALFLPKSMQWPFYEKQLKLCCCSMINHKLWYQILAISYIKYSYLFFFSCSVYKNRFSQNTGHDAKVTFWSWFSMWKP